MRILRLNALTNGTCTPTRSLTNYSFGNERLCFCVSKIYYSPCRSKIRFVQTRIFLKLLLVELLHLAAPPKFFRDIFPPRFAFAQKCQTSYHNAGAYVVCLRCGFSIELFFFSIYCTVFDSLSFTLEVHRVS